MADETYQPLVYRKQGSTEFVVASSGLITVESGGKVELVSGGYINAASGGYINVEDGGYIAQPVVADTSSAALASNGVSTIENGSSVLFTVTMDAPVAGVSKFISFGSGFGTSAICYLDLGAAVTVLSSAASTERYMSVKGSQTWVNLIGLSATVWGLVSRSSGITTTTGSTV